MPINLSAIGSTRTITNVITPRWALAYSSSLGFCGAEYLDDDKPSTVVVPPTFCVCLEWTLTDVDSRASLLGLDMRERRMGVHALQDSRFYRPFRLGMSVVTTSTLEYMRRTRAGTFMLTRFEHSDAETGKRIATSFSGGMLRGIDIPQEAAGNMPADFDEPHDLQEADIELPTVQMDRTLPHVYSECARIWNPIHTERAVALAAGLEDIIVHGTITWTLAAAAVCRSTGAGNLGAIRRLTARFRAPIVAGQPMTVRRSDPSSANTVDFVAANERGQMILSDGRLQLG